MRRNYSIIGSMTKIRPSIVLLLLVVALVTTINIIAFKNTKQRGANCPKCSQTSIDTQEAKLKPPISLDADDGPREKARAAIVILARNSDIEGLNKTIPQFESTFNGKFQYPYVFLNDVPFNENFKTAMKRLTKAEMKFGTIPHEHWSYPAWINQTKAAEVRMDMKRRNIIYGDSLPYRHMCRYNSGFFFRHPLLKDYDFYWRVEPWVEFYCKVNYDPFLFMQQNDKKYGFVIMLPEYIETVPTLWKTVKSFMKENEHLVNKDNCLKMFDDGTETYNLCHFWSNFEIGDLNFFRSDKYLKYFDYLDKAGGFFYERWGDAPVHSIAAAMFLKKEQIHWFEDIGYFHNPFRNCPSNPGLQLNCNSQCLPNKSVNIGNNCHKRYLELFSNRH